MQAREAAFAVLHGVFALEYAKPSQLWHVDRNDGTVSTIHSTRGTRQGSVCGPVFFCLAIHDALLRAAEQRIATLAYMDDVTLVATGEACEAGGRLAAGVAAAESVMNACGLELNGKKCQWVSTTHPPPGWTQYALPTLKLLGAHIATSGGAHTSGTEREALNGENAQHELFFRRLGKVRGPPATALLGKCGVPRMSYVLRTHAPDVTAEAAAHFDTMVDTTWRRLAGVAQQELHLADAITAHLPTKLGGMGFSRMAWLRNAAYAASLAAAGIAEAPPQKQATATLNDILLQALPEKRRRVLHVNAAGKGLSSWFCDPSTSMAPRVFSAAMRLRLGATHHRLHKREPCPGCEMAFEPREWTQHVVGCTRLRGVNASTRHAAVKDALKRAIADHATAATGVAQTEPRWAKTTQCPACRTEMKIAEWKAHADACRALTPAQRSVVPHASGPDVEIHTRDGTILVDVTVVNPLNPSAKGRSAKTLATQVSKKKQKKYGRMAEEEGCELVVAAVSAQGELSADFERLLLRLVPDGFHEARRAVSAAAVAGSGRALICAERTATGTKHPTTDEEEEERATRTGRFMAHLMIPPDCWEALGAMGAEEEEEEVDGDVSDSSAAHTIDAPAAAAHDVDVDEEWME